MSHDIVQDLLERARYLAGLTDIGVPRETVVGVARAAAVATEAPVPESVASVIDPPCMWLRPTAVVPAVSVV